RRVPRGTWRARRRLRVAGARLRSARLGPGIRQSPLDSAPPPRRPPLAAADEEVGLRGLRKAPGTQGGSPRSEWVTMLREVRAQTPAPAAVRAEGEFDPRPEHAVKTRP